MSKAPYDIIVVHFADFILRSDMRPKWTTGDSARLLLSELDKAGYVIVPKADLASRTENERLWKLLEIVWGSGAVAGLSCEEQIRRALENKP